MRMRWIYLTIFQGMLQVESKDKESVADPRCLMVSKDI